MATFTQGQQTETIAAIYASVLGVIGGPGVPSMQAFVHDHAAIAGGLTLVDHRTPVSPSTFPGEEVFHASGGYDFFERFHVVARAHDLGNVLSSQSIPFEVFHASRRTRREWTSFANNAGVGVSIGGLPGLPVDMDPFTAYALTLDIDATGDPFVDGTLDFVFETGTTIVTIELQRIVLWSLRPELPFVEALGFLTDVIGAKSGKEKRHSLRKAPRQTFVYDYRIEDADRRTFENRLFDFQPRQFAVPVWYDDSQLTVAASAGATTVTVNSTSFRDFRVGGLAVVLAADGTFDVLNLVAITSTTLESDAPILNSYAVGTEVFPLSTARMSQRISGRRWPKNLSGMQIAFRVSDNDVDLADVSAWTSYDSKPVLDTGVIVRSGGTSPETFAQRFIVVDSQTGLLEQTSPWPNNRRGSQLILRGRGREEAWNLRRLAYWLRGRQMSFYVPRDLPDLVITDDLLSAGSTFEVENDGYSQFVRSRQPRNVVRITLNDGTELFREITDAAVSGDPTKETLTVDVPWASTVAVEDIASATFVEKVRLDTDDVRLEYSTDPLIVYLAAPILAVLE